MKRLLFASILALLLSFTAAAQQPGRGRLTYGIGEPQPPKVDHTLEQLIDARAKLIYWYVLSSSNYAWGVSVCGGEDMFTGDESSWLTIYVYKDSLAAFAKDFDKAATRNRGGSLGVDGITVVVEVIQRPKKTGADNEPKIERNDRQPAHRNSGSGSAVPSRPSRS